MLFKPRSSLDFAQHREALSQQRGQMTPLRDRFAGAKAMLERVLIALWSARTSRANVHAATRLSAHRW